MGYFLSLEYVAVLLQAQLSAWERKHEVLKKQKTWTEGVAQIYCI